MGSSRFESKGSHNTERGLHPPLPVQTQSNQVTNSHKQIYQPTKTVAPFGGTVSADKQKCSRTGRKLKLTGVLQPAIFGTQTQQPVETHPGPEHSEHRVVQNGDPRDNKDLPSARVVGHLHRLQGRILPHTNHSQSKKFMRFHIQGQSYQFKALPFGLSTAPMEFTVVAKEVKLMALQKGIRIHQYLVGESHIPPNLSPAYTDLGSSLSRTRVAGEPEVRTEPKTGPQLRRLPVRPHGGQGQTHTRALADLNRQDTVNPIRSGVPGPAVHVPYRPSNSHRKTNPPGRFHMRPIQWHLKNNWRVPESLEKVIPIPRSLHPHLKWWLEESNVLPGQLLLPLKHALQIFTDASKEGWGARLNKRPGEPGQFQKASCT